MQETDAGINSEELLAQDIRPEQVAEVEQQLVEEPDITDDFADWVLVEGIFNSEASDEDIHEGGYVEPRLSPTREPATGWAENTPQLIREAAAAVRDPDLKQQSDDLQGVLEQIQQKFRCVACDTEVNAQKDLHYCQTCQISRCKECIAKHWLDVDNKCAQFASWWMVQWARTALQVKLQKYQYKTVASEIAAKGIEHRRQHRADSASLASKYDLLKEYNGEPKCQFAEESGPGTHYVPFAEPVVCCVRCKTQPLCKRCFKHLDKRLAVGDMRNCSVCQAFCHKNCGSLPEDEENFRCGHANFRCPKCAETQPEVVPPWRSSARGKGVKREFMRGPASDDEWEQYNYSGSDQPVFDMGDTSETCGLESPSRKPDSYGW